MYHLRACIYIYKYSIYSIPQFKMAVQHFPVKSLPRCHIEERYDTQQRSRQAQRIAQISFCCFPL